MSNELAKWACEKCGREFLRMPPDSPMKDPFGGCGGQLLSIIRDSRCVSERDRFRDHVTNAVYNAGSIFELARDKGLIRVDPHGIAEKLAAYADSLYLAALREKP